jgi:hypothetical protein
LTIKIFQDFFLKFFFARTFLRILTQSYVTIFYISSNHGSCNTKIGLFVQIKFSLVRGFLPFFRDLKCYFRNRPLIVMKNVLKDWSYDLLPVTSSPKSSHCENRLPLLYCTALCTGLRFKLKDKCVCTSVKVVILNRKQKF